MGDGDEYSLDLTDVEPDGLVDVQPRITGRPGEDLTANPIVTVRERRWLNRFKKTVQSVTKTLSVATGNVRPVRDNGLCWDEVERRDDVLTYDEQQIWQKYEDWEFDVRIDDYTRWVNSNPGIRIETHPGAQIPPDGVLEWPRMSIRDLEGRDFLPPETQRQVGSGWAQTGGEPVGPPRVVERGVPSWAATEKKPCPDIKTGTDDGPSTETALFKAVDLDTGEPVGGSMVFKGVIGLTEIPRPISDPAFGYTLFGHLGGTYTVVYHPPAGYEVVSNSEKQTPADTLAVSLDTHLEGIRLFVYDVRKVKPADAPKKAEPPAGSGEDEGLPLPPVKSSKHGFRLPRWSLFGVLLLLLLLVLLFTLHPFGTSTSPSAGKGTSTTSPSAGPSPTTSLPAGKVFPPNRVFDGCLMIDPHGDVTTLAAAFTVSNPESGTYRATFARSPSGPLSGTGTAAGGTNPVVVPMRATAFGTYGELSIVSPDGDPVALGPLKGLLPLELNAETDRRNDCDPSALTPPSPRALAGRDYLAAVAPVNAAGPAFLGRVDEWTEATLDAEAVRDAGPLLRALQDLRPQLGTIAATYPPAGDDLGIVDAAAARLIEDLSDLDQLATVGLAEWRSRFHDALAQLTDASRNVRGDLALPEPA